jgi:hypothetical protein
VSLEISSNGHIHIHALCFVPFVLSAYLAKLAGCFVDVRQVGTNGLSPADALKEACKYAVKAPRLSQGWASGERAVVTNPVLAARWALAQQNKQLGKVFGLIRDALKAQDAITDTDTSDTEECSKDSKCPKCCEVLWKARSQYTHTVALELGSHGVSWRARARIVRVVRLVQPTEKQLE